MLLLIIFAFLFNFLILFSLNFYIKTINNVYVKFISLYFLSVSLILSLYISYNMLLKPELIYILDLGVWLEFDNLKIKWEFIFDSMNILMILTVIIISILVHIYSFDYMKLDIHFTRFISFLSLFTFFMLILLSANNFIVMFIGWEGVGLCSYLLINFWFTRIQANKAAIKAILINKIGDISILFSFILIFSLWQNFDYHTVFLLVKPNKILNYICLFLFFGCMAKSAQIGLHMWLPDAMEGPTPVSALIHAATMVTAGVFLVIKCSFMFELSNLILIFISIIGLFTAIFGASVGIFQFDIKKIIAYSTCSQLGLMFCACGLSAYSLGLFHLINHAFFKALLFLCAGSIIHALNDEQDIRKMGGLAKKLPITYQSMLIASLSLIGFPFLSGYYSKELILLLIFLDNFQKNKFGFFIVVFTSILTVMYSLKILLYVFFDKFNGLKIRYQNIHEVSFLIIFVYVILISFSILSGYMLKDLLIGYGSIYLNNSIIYLPKNYNLSYLEFITFKIKYVILCIPICGILLYKDYIYTNLKMYTKESYIYFLIYYFFNKKYFFDRLLNESVLLIINLCLNYFYICIDKGLIEASINLIIEKIMKLANTINSYNKFNLFTYLYLIFLNLILSFIIMVCLIFFKIKCILFFILIIGFKFFYWAKPLLCQIFDWLVDDYYWANFKFLERNEKNLYRIFFIVGFLISLNYISEFNVSYNLENDIVYEKTDPEMTYINKQGYKTTISGEIIDAPEKCFCEKADLHERFANVRMLGMHPRNQIIHPNCKCDHFRGIRRLCKYCDYYAADSIFTVIWSALKNYFKKKK